MNRSLASLLAALLAFALLGAGCSSTRAAGEGPMDEALAAVQGGGGTPREKALAGWHAYLVAGDVKAAQGFFNGAGDDVAALAGKLELARRALSLEDRARAAVQLVNTDPQGPFGRVGAHAVLDLVGQSSQLDDLLLAGAQEALKKPLAPGVAFPLRVAVARVAELRSTEGWSKRFAEAGVLQEFAVAGPFGALHRLDLAETYPPETENALRDTYATPVGTVRTRALQFPSGEARLYGEPERGDIYFLAADLKAQGGAYVLHVGSASPYVIYVDGQKVLARAQVTTEPPQAAVSLQLSAGPHRVMVKLSRAEGGTIALALVRGDGAAEDLGAHAPRGPAPAGASTVVDAALPGIGVKAQQLYGALAPEVGALTARFIAVRDALPRDHEGLKALIADAEPLPATGAWLLLRGQATLGDRSLPDRTAKGRGGRDLEAATTKDPGEASAWLVRSTLAREGDRLDDASAYLSKAQAATRSALVALGEARVALARGLEPVADAAARRAVELSPGECEALELRYELARRREAIAEADALNKALAVCPDGLERTAEHARARADLAGAERAQRARLERQPSNLRVAEELAQALSAAKRYDEARKVLEAQLPLWPRSADLHKRLADVLTLAGDAAGALAEKRAALALDGSDLALRRQLALAQGHDLLDEFAVDSKQVIADYQKAPRPPGAEDAAAAYVLDLAGIQVFPDNTQIERIHTIAQVLDQRGIPQLAEQRLPANAIPLKLQTIKKDGRVLEPESIGEKEGVSLPDVQVGDFVEVEYLAVTPPRSPAEPGFSSVPFYFRIAESPLFRSTFTLKAPANTPIKVDAHNMDAPTPKVQSDGIVVHHEARQVPLFIPEPGAPGGNEYLPFVQVGTGAGAADALWPFADNIIGHDLPTLEVTQFARAAVGEKTGIEAVKALYAAVMEKVKGDENDINDRAASVLARERGSRLWLLKGALRALGIPAHLAVVRPLSADPAPYLFPNTDLFTYPVLYVELPDQEPLWLDPSARFAPFGRVPEQVAGERDAMVLPEPGEKMRKVRTPPSHAAEPKQVKLHLVLSPEGEVTADGEETYSGFDAAFLRSALERYDENQRKQAVEVALARSFRGARLDQLEVVGDAAVGAPITLRYKFTSPRFARAEGNRLVLATPIFPAALGQRYVALAQRTTPLLLSGSESAVTQIRIDLPVGFKVTSAGQPASIQTPFGSYQRATKALGTTLEIDEAAQLNLGRIAPKAYPDFVRFTAAVDQAQQQEIDLER